MEDSPATAAAASIGSTPSCGVIAEQRDDVGVLGLVVGVPIAHLPVFQHAGLVALLGVTNLVEACAVGHRVSPFVINLGG